MKNETEKSGAIRAVQPPCPERDDLEPGGCTSVKEHKHPHGEAHGHCHDNCCCSAGCDDCEHGKEEGGWKLTVVRLVCSLALTLCARLIPMPFPVSLALFLAAYLVIGYDVLWRAAKSVARGRIFTEHFLMSIATVGALSIGDYTEGIAVMLLYQLGELLQDVAVRRSRRSIAALMDIRPDFARVRTPEGPVLRDPDEVAVGDIILVHPGERVPLDGVVAAGCSLLDASALTGESLPREAAPGDEVLSGSINQSATLELEVLRAFHDSAVSRILELTQNETARKANTETFITRFARVYTPAVVIGAVLVALLPPLFLGWNTFGDWFYRALIFLVISCPCALVISIPLGFFGGIGAASRHGILVKGGGSLEALCRTRTVVFDKTGTLTEGAFSVKEILPASGTDTDELLEAAAWAESRSSHPIAASILRRYGRPLDESQIVESGETAGHGTRVVLTNGDVYLTGNGRLFDKEAIVVPAFEASVGTTVSVAKNGIFLGRLILADALKPGSAAAVHALSSLGVRDVVMLTGDTEEIAEQIAREAGVTNWKAELLPQDKVAAVDALSREHPEETLAFVGDGINDAPVIARADVGVAMGGIGSDAAIEAADVVLMTDDLEKLPLAIRIARKTRRIVLENVVLALGVKGIVLLLGLFGLSSMWAAIFADVGVALLAVCNALRVLRVPKN